MLNSLGSSRASFQAGKQTSVGRTISVVGQCDANVLDQKPSDPFLPPYASNLNAARLSKS